MLQYVILLSILGLTTVAGNSCLQCSSSLTNFGCITPDENPVYQSCNIPANNNNTCFSRISLDGREVERGCMSDMTREQFSNCRNETNCELCYDLANGGKCNNKIFPSHRLQCYQCEGNLTSTCATDVTGTPSPCRHYDTKDQCYTSVVQDLVQRGCTSASVYCQHEGACKVCDGHGCNSKHYSSAMSNFVSKYTILFVAISLLVGVLKL